MCDPSLLAAAQVVPAMVSSVMGFVGQNQAAAANKKAANLSYANTENQLTQKASQVDAQQSENTVQAAISRITSQGRISASASSFGADASGATREANAADFAVGRGLSIENVNSDNQRVAIGGEQDNAFYARQSQINQVLPQSPIQLALGLAKAANAGIGAFAQFGGTFPSGPGSAGNVDTSGLGAMVNPDLGSGTPTFLAGT